MKEKLIQATATIVGAVIQKTGPSATIEDLFIQVYRQLESAELKIQQQDLKKHPVKVQPLQI